MTDTPLRGVFAVSTTPYGADGEQDLSLLEASTNRVLEAGVDGILALGATGEALALDDRERETQIRGLLEIVDGRAPVVVGCMAYRPDDVSALIAQAKEWGADAAMVTPSFYGGLEPSAAVAALEPVIERADLPVMLYNNPHSTGVDLLPEDIASLTKHDAFWAVKETSGAATRVRELRTTLGNDVDIFVGADGLALEGFTQGASGWVAASGWLTPTRCVRLWRLAQGGDWKGAVELWDQLAGPLGQIEADPAFISLIKKTLGALGYKQGDVRPPLPSATQESVHSLQAQLAALGGRH